MIDRTHLRNFLNSIPGLEGWSDSVEHLNGVEMLLDTPDLLSLLWRPIESAPKDGTMILAHIPFRWSNGTPSSTMDVIAWDARAGFWFSPTAPNYVQACDSRCQPTRWMPLPVSKV